MKYSVQAEILSSVVSNNYMYIKSIYLVMRHDIVYTIFSEYLKNYTCNRKNGGGQFCY